MRILGLVLFVPLVAALGCTETGNPNQTADDAVTPASNGAADNANGAAPNDADNTGRNVRDRDPQTRTPFDQQENAADLKITQEIRQAVSDDDSLSTDAQNVKIMTANGRVTLRGPVKSAAEREKIVQAATRAAGEGNVDDQIEVQAE
jgi:osmotically-inducible protein OsmY